MVLPFHFSPTFSPQPSAPLNRCKGQRWQGMYPNDRDHPDTSRSSHPVSFSFPPYLALPSAPVCAPVCSPGCSGYHPN
jgi:hypothetical protein